MTNEEKQALVEWCNWRTEKGQNTLLADASFNAAVIAHAALTAQPVKLPESFYGVIQDGKVVMIPADDGQWLNKTTVEEGFRALEQRAEAAEAEKAGAEERCRMMFDANNHWADRARVAEAKLAELEKQEPVFQVEVSGNHWLNAGPLDDSDFTGLPEGINLLFARPATHTGSIT
ncbi:hypothetical protein [Pantoea agglomerans]|jgi:hypothetical protein|uniref:hypothetical protein n=1 Tax=Enterobacter agglomerans TaxID=549 RepID=UPI00191A44B5|nr:hypothetical protein [Pantoea agglomerans]SMQ21850.1 hypothetical protein SAMN02744765_0742 [Pantoea agglomerans]